ncbi:MULTISPECIES: PBSX family phage terminase large subunit [unclassified Streptomyces]|uniref:PBSX family phage terminase large subunit n=1 Tax=unclassified Streptomyces TaxID=2593676 RepID=UPI00190C4FC8|nr:MULTISPECIES: PBSX family phage terminase large subunit [unclassified Streptomyces]MBK3563213.1 PBSX family phage terminase large subunit [Streptomyces sp. MBT62]MBK6013202.1 PBSX family phage terminase large subunit [Streptomyces sp. MBT53]
MYDALVGKQLRSTQLATARGNLWEGAVRSSKTISSIMVWLRYIRTGPPGALLMVGKTERTLKRNIIDVIVAMVGVKRCKFKAGAGEVVIFGRTIYVAGANDERAADKIKGMTLAGAYCDEVTTFPESFFSMLGTRLSVEGSQWFGTTNPEGPNHWLKKKFLDRARLHVQRDGTEVTSEDPKALDLHRFSFSLHDNPYLPPAYVANLKLEYQGLFYRRFVLGEWCLAEGVVYDMFDETKHVVDVIPEVRHWMCVGLDYGTINPFAALLVGIGVDDRLYVASEYRHDSRAERRQLTDAQYSLAVRQWLATYKHQGQEGVHPQWIFVDPSAASFMTQLWSDGVQGVAKANNEVKDGIRSVSVALGSDLLYVHRSCAGLLTELPSYAWDEKAAAAGDDKPLKVDDHSVDALRYGLHSTAHEWRHLVRANLEVAA